MNLAVINGVNDGYKEAILDNDITVYSKETITNNSNSDEVAMAFLEGKYN
jgi:hypothetical protein